MLPTADFKLFFNLIILKNLQGLIRYLHFFNIPTVKNKHFHLF